MGILGWIGWVLFALVLLQYFVGTYANVKKNQAIAFYCSAMLMDRQFYEEQYGDMQDIVEFNKDMPIDELTKRFMDSVQGIAEQYGDAEYCVRNRLPFAPATLRAQLINWTRYYKNKGDNPIVTEEERQALIADIREKLK